MTLWLLTLAALWLAVYGTVRYLGRRGRLPAGLHRDVAALGLLGLAAIGFFWRPLFTDAWLPSGGGDLGPFLYPVYSFAARSLKSGILPLWNPYLYSGAPFAADIQSGLFYPINLLVFWLAPQITYPTVIGLAMFHFYLAGALMYVCLRGWRLIRLPALAGAIAFMFADFFIVHFGNLNMLAAGAWLPLIFLCYHRALAPTFRSRSRWIADPAADRGSAVSRAENRLDAGRSGWAVAAGLFLATSILAGHIQTTLFIVLTLALYTLWQTCFLWRESRRETSRSPIARSLVSLLTYPLLTFLVAFGLSALLLIPAYEMTGHTLRAEVSYAEASRYSLQPAQLIGLVVPAFFNRDPRFHWGPWDRVETGYAGILTLVLAAVAIGLRRDRLTRFLALLGLLALLLALGGNTIVHGWLYSLLPGFDKLRAPARFTFLLGFALAALAALGLDTLLHPRPADSSGSPPAALRPILRSLTWVWGGACLFGLPAGYYALLVSQDKDPVIFNRVAAALNGLVWFILLLAASLVLLRFRHRLSGAAFGWLAVALIALDLFSMGAYLDLGDRDPTFGFDHPAAIAFLKSDPSLYRIDTRTGIWHLWQPDTSLLHDIGDVWGVVNPLTLADYNRYWEGMGSRSSALYDFLNAKYVVGSKDVPLDWDKFAPVFDGDPDLNIYLNRRALPRALLVHRALAVADHESAWQAIHQPGFDPATTVVVEGGQGLAAPPDPAETLRVTSYTPNEITLEATTATDAYLVLSEVYYPGWRAEVDGQPAAVVRANYTFRAVRLGPGSHRVRLTFRPSSWWLGLGLSALTGAAVLLWALWALVTKVREPSDKSGNPGANLHPGK